MREESGPSLYLHSYHGLDTLQVPARGKVSPSHSPQAFPLPPPHPQCVGRDTGSNGEERPRGRESLLQRVEKKFILLEIHWAAFMDEIGEPSFAQRLGTLGRKK